MYRSQTLFLSAALLLTFLSTSCIMNPQPDDCLEITGTVTNVFEGGVKDACFRLEGDSRMFYINRGLQYGLNLDSLQLLMGQEVTMMYVDMWTPLDPDGTIRHVSQLKKGDELIYTEFD